ncbi:TipJ family phage tail tip protein [Pseudomonas orientalis]|uniref:TipJ family phage tail tip protein n=1 Tax=Pseudomonas orientalis TaxID=76758 RepID=UPI000F560B2E|nr:phage tail protein [Pseudomonas orientalis]AZE90202.1 Phage tail fiber protein [Pseudomonas orientalis]
MGPARKIDIHGAKGGEEKPKTPTEAPDSLRSVAIAKMLIAVGEGEFEGTPTARDIYLDNTPLQDPQGNMNFPNVKWEWRTGAVDQTYIQGIPSVENETTISTELRSGTPWIRAINNTQLSAVRVRFAWPALQSVDAGGNINGYRIEYKVELATDGGAYQQVLSEAVDGKTTSVYERTRRIDLPKATTGWLMRITRITLNQNNNKISDTMQIAGFTEVIDAKIRYPNTALLYVEFSAEQFRSIPAVTVETKLKKMQVPSNYEPVSRSYSGVWDGTFKQAWTDNPVWMTYDITTADRFGLGRRIKPWMVDKWELYRISQYCDQLVPDGKGGQEPRFICNLNLQSKADAWSLLQDISTIYRGMTYWAQGQVFTLADMPRATDFDFAYTSANVIDGKFTYSSASERTRYTRALISYDNPLNNYDTDVTAVTDQKLQRRYGDNPLEISAIGCTRESEAQRRGKWALLTNSKDRAVTFRVGLDGRLPLPGYVIPIADELLAGRPVGGRISAVNGKVITLDRDTQAKPGDRLILNLPDGKCEGRTVQLVSGRQVTMTVAYSVPPEPELVWALDADDLAIPLYRVVSVARPEAGVFEISAVQYDPSKFAHIDTGARLEERPISVIPITVVPAPASVTLTSSYAVNQGIAISTMNISWPAVTGAVAYDVEWRKDSGNWIRVQRTGSTSVDVTGIYSGAYLARVRAVSAFDISSVWKNSILTNLQGKTGLPPAVSFLTTKSELFGISIKWGFPAGAEDTQRTELWYGPVNYLQAATKLADLAYPQADYRMQSLLAGATLFFWARLVDRTGNIGPFYPVVNGIMGQSSSDAAAILEQIKGQIDETSLGQLLNARINLIDGTGPGSVNGRIAATKAELEQLIDQVVDALEWVPDKAYLKGDIVRQGQNLYQAIAPVPANIQPPSANYWFNMGSIAETTRAMALEIQQNSASITEIGTEVTSQATQLSAVKATVNDPTTGVNATATGLSTLKATVTTLNGKVITTAERVDGIYLQVNPPLQGDDSALMGSEASYVGVWSTQSALIEGDLVQGQRTDLVEVKVANNAAATIAEQTARINADSALSSSIETVKTTVGGNSLAIQTNSTAIQTVNGKITANWSVRMQYESATGLYKYAGIGLGLENGPGGLQSQFIIDADRFAIGQAGTVPFAVTGGQTFIQAAFIQDGTITNAKIGAYISSTNYIAGQQGWILNKDGTFEINGLVPGQGRSIMTNRSLRFFDVNGVKRVQIGDLSE